MVMQRYLLVLAGFFMVIILAGCVNAGNANFTLNGNLGTMLDLSVSNTINITIGAMESNITVIAFAFQSSAFDPDLYVVNSNGTAVSNYTFINSSSGTPTITTYLNFSNATSYLTLVPNGTQRAFWFDIVARRQYTGSFLTLNVTTYNSSGAINATSYNFQPSFAFTGYMLNETGCSNCWQNDTNVSLTGIIDGGFGPPTTNILGSALSNNSGYFKITKVNASFAYRGYRLNTIYYNATGTATKVGNIMPDFPAMMYYGGMGGGFDMSLNGGTFYLQQAATINISANNGTAQVSFGYELVDQTLGFPIASEITRKITNTSIVVPAGRAYVVSFFRIFSYPGSAFGYIYNATVCLNNATSDFMNDTLCPTPPKSYTISASSTSAGSVININQSLIVRKAQMTGCLNINAGANSSMINVTRVIAKMLPWTTDSGSFVPPSNGDDGSINVTSNINYTYSGCPYAFYNISLLNNTGYMLEFYAKNGSVESNNPGSAFNLAGLQNLTALDNNVRVNATLFRLSGIYRNDTTNGVSVNTSMIRINVVNSSGGVITSSVNVNYKVRNTAAGIGTVFYMITPDNIINGSFYIPVLNNSNFAKVMVFSQNGPPKESSINLSANEFNVTVISMGIDKGFRKFNPNGTVATHNTNTLPIQMRFLRNTADCYSANAPASCDITTMNASGFNPLKAMLAGKVTMEIKITSTNVSLLFQNYDMLTAKQPPMESIFDESAAGRSTSGRNVQDTWNFGSFAPADSYTNVTIVMPYSDTSGGSNYIDDSQPVSVSIPTLYDENSRAIWNVSRGDSAAANLTDDFIMYNNSYYRNLLTSSGISCNATFASTCFMNSSGNYIALRVPHFSTISAAIAGIGAVASSSTSSSDSPGGGGTLINSNEFWQSTYQYDDKELSVKGPIQRDLGEKERMRILVNGEQHYVGILKVEGNKVTINVSSVSQQATIGMGESAFFELNNDSYYDLRVSVINIGAKVNVLVESVYEKMTEVEKAAVQKGESAPRIEPTTPPTTKDTGFGITIIVIVLVLAAVIIWYIHSRKKL